MTTYRFWSEESSSPILMEEWTLKPIDFIFIFSTPKPKIRWKMYQKCINSRNFQMTIPERRSVVGNDDHFSLALSKCFQSLPVSENIFSRFHHQGKPGIDVLNALFLQIYGIQKYIWHTKCTFVALSTRITANLKKKYEHNWRHSLN